MTTQKRSDIGLGASEIAAVAGLHPFASPWDVWLAKTGQSTFAGNELTEWGHRLEPAIRQAYSDKTGHTVEVPATSMFHPSRAWQRATPDGIVYAADRVIMRLFQAKNVGEWAARKSWGNGVPDYVQLQEQWEMDVTGARVADVVALVGGHEFRMHEVSYDPRIAADLVEIGAAFMDRVARGVPPPPDASEACKEHLTAQLRTAQVVEFYADAETEAVLAEWRRLHIEAKRIDRAIEKARNAVRQVFAAAQCDRVAWSGGVLRLQAAREDERTNYEAIARLIASAKGVTEAEFAALVKANTAKKTVGPILSAPANWKEK